MSYEHSKPAAKIKVLHVVGSPDSLFYFKLDIFYASYCKEFGNYVFHYALIHPDGLWSFPKSIGVDTKTDGEIPLDKAMAKIRLIKPAFIIHHLFCKRGHSEYRGIIEALNFPVLGSTAEVTAITQSKSETKDVLHKHGVKVPAGRIIRKNDKLDDFISELQFPCVVKPDMTEDSVGVSLVRRKDQFHEALEEAFKHGDVAVVEKFISGREIRIGVISDSKSNLQVLPALEYLNVKKDEIRSFDKKLEVDDKGLPTGQAACSRPSFVDGEKEPQIIQRLSESAISAVRALRIRDFVIFDFRVDDDGMPWILEANLFCSFGEKSILAMMAKQTGISLQQMFNQIAENAMTRNNSEGH